MPISLRRGAPPQSKKPQEEEAPPPPPPRPEEALDTMDFGRADDAQGGESPGLRPGAAYHELAKFIKYMQKRMDFIAQVTTSPPSWCFSTSWKELLDTFAQQSCLTDNIIRSHHEVFSADAADGWEPAEPAAPARAGDRDGEFVPRFRFWLGEREIKLDEPGADFPDVDIPHAQIGAHAFYTILENLIRNSAKYSDRKELRRTRGQLIFDIKLEESWAGDVRSWSKEFLRVTVSDNLRTRLHRPPAAHAPAAAAPPEEESITSRLNDFLKRPIIDPETMTLAPGGWGMKEIKICAAYLRMIDQDRIDERFNHLRSGRGWEPPVIDATLTDTAGAGADLSGKLTFVFYLLRSKTALIVDDEEKIKRGVSPEFLRRGIDFYAPKLLRSLVEEGEGLRHGLLLLFKKHIGEDKKLPLSWTWLAENINFLPHRIIVIGEEKGALKQLPELKPRVVFVGSHDYNSMEKASPQALLDFLWEQWTRRNWKDHVLCVRWKDGGVDVNADRAEPESWDNPKGEDMSKWLVYDHRDGADATDLYRQSAFHQAFSSGSVTAEMLATENRDRIKEAALLSVVIIDERIWMERGVRVSGVEAAKYKAEENRRLCEYWKKRRVYIQDTDSVLRDFAGFVKGLRKTLPAVGEPQVHGQSARMCDFLVIHQTILDSLKSKDHGFETHWSELKQIARWVVIDTGRGQPERARQEKLRWVEYSNLAECLVGYAGDKFRLAHLLSRLRASSAKLRE